MEPYKMLDITAVLLVVGFLSYAGVVFVKPDAVISDPVETSVSSPAGYGGPGKADSGQLPTAKAAQLAESIQSDFPVVQDDSRQSGDESEFYISASHAHLTDEVIQSLSAQTTALPSSRSSSALSSARTGCSSSTGSSGSSLGSGGGGGSSANQADSSKNSMPIYRGGGGTAVTIEYEKQLPEWIQREGIRAGFFSSACDTNYEQKMKAVGFNTVIATRFCYDFAHLSGIMKDYTIHARACAQADMHMFAAYPWQPGNEWKTPTYRSVVFADGTEGLFPCPLDENFWQQYLVNIAVEIAKISVEKSCRIDGIFWDMEMYGTGYPEVPLEKRAYSETTCFCDFCFTGFINARTQITNMPPLQRDRRKAWLLQNGYLPDYYAYLEAQVETKAERLKNRVHAVNPDLLLGLYPALNSSNWVRTAVVRAFGRNSYPVISFSTDTYGYYSKPWGANRIPTDLSAYFEEFDINGIYVAGYMFCKYTSAEIREHLIKSCQRSQGYWLWDMAHVLDEDLIENLKEGTQEDYLQAIKSANMTLGTR